MRDDWILGVLDDLREYARLNGLPALAQQLEQAQRVALAELRAAAVFGAAPPRRDGPPN